MKFNNFIHGQFVDKFDTSENSELPKISSLKSMFIKQYLSQYLIDSNKLDLKVKLNSVASTNSHILFIDLIKLKLRLINFVYFFETPDRPLEFQKYHVLQISVLSFRAMGMSKRLQIRHNIDLSCTVLLFR